MKIEKLELFKQVQCPVLREKRCYIKPAMTRLHLVNAVQGQGTKNLDGIGGGRTKN